MKILGLDPGSSKMGYGVLSFQDESLSYIKSGVVTPKVSLSFPRKLFCLQSQLEGVLQIHLPDVVVIERAFFGKNAESAFKLGQVRGICLSSAAKYKAKVCELAARRVKKLVTGNGAAEKTHVQLIVARLLRVNQFTSLDESDALAMAIAFQREYLAAQVLAAGENHQNRGVQP